MYSLGLKCESRHALGGTFSVAQMAFQGYLGLIRPLEATEMYWFLDEVSYPVLYPSLYTHSYSVKLLIWDKGRIGSGGKMAATV